ncbi:conserved hypothetical protein [Agrobacterium deltaense NCPPB 1641]|uniref:Uncharacterized protein n=1 Tax=Agrobacterium deltaense NCPPB 1641 TaxID=1183425 RepID=A0A1S7U964_9HYPH|nr:conserved hypothetical protein [Agrobacterium deltaense NCPPB 1641]
MTPSAGLYHPLVKMEISLNSDVPSISELLEQQERLQISKFDYAFAWELGSRIYHLGRAEKLPIAIQIRHGTDIVFSALAPGATIDNFDWVRRKCAVVHRFHQSSLYVRLQAEEKGYDFNTRFRLAAADYGASGGAVPILLKGGTFIGSAGVSGLPDVQDHLLVTDCLSELIKAQ